MASFRENNNEFLSNIVKIRENTGLKQEEFYNEYLRSVDSSNINSDSGAQDRMKRLENGYAPVLPSMLPVYAKLGECSIEELISSDVQIIKNKKLTARDVCKILVQIDDSFELNYEFAPHTIAGVGERTEVFFSVYPKFAELCEKGGMNFIGQYIYINEFLKNYIEICKDERIPEKQRSVLLESFLNEVPNEYATLLEKKKE